MKDLAKQERKLILEKQMKLLEMAANKILDDELPEYINTIIDLNNELPINNNPFLNELLLQLNKITERYIESSDGILNDVGLVLDITESMIKLNRELDRIDTQTEEIMQKAINTNKSDYMFKEAVQRC